jgi:quinol monooxygenase YgiN
VLARLTGVLGPIRFRGRKAASRSFVAVAHWTALPGEEKEVEQVLQQLASASRAEPGCITYSAHRSVDDPTQYLIYERYTDEAAFQRHIESDHFQALVLADAIPRLASRTRQTYTVLS